MGEIFTVDDIRRSSWREDLEERENYEYERRERELTAERERQQARKAREAETASANWYVAMDGRIHEHLANWLWKAIDERIEQNLKLHFFSGELGVGGAVIGGLTDAVGGLVGKLKRTIEEQQRAFEAKLAALEQHLASNNQAVDGCLEAAIARERAAIGEAQIQLREEVKRAIAELCDAFGARLAEQKEHFLSVPGRLPVAKIWLQESVIYEGEVVSYDGSLYQARKDTAQMPGGSDWICVARAGRDGLTPNVRGAFDVYKKYAQLDVVEYEDASYIARRDVPGLCPGDGWQIVSRSGRRGPAGEVGPRGRPGVRGARGEVGRWIVKIIAPFQR